MIKKNITITNIGIMDINKNSFDITKKKLDLIEKALNNSTDLESIYYNMFERDFNILNFDDKILESILNSKIKLNFCDLNIKSFNNFSYFDLLIEKIEEKSLIIENSKKMNNLHELILEKNNELFQKKKKILEKIKKALEREDNIEIKNELILYKEFLEDNISKFINRKERIGCDFIEITNAFNRTNIIDISDDDFEKETLPNIMDIRDVPSYSDTESETENFFPNIDSLIEDNKEHVFIPSCYEDEYTYLECLLDFLKLCY